MCGIVSYVGDRPAVPILLAGLNRLEYRGYDSAGIAVLNADGGIDFAKEAGRLQTLVELLATRPIAGNIGIGHTRWATHGSPTAINAHPHGNESSELFLVHNGIIENFLQLREELATRGHEIRSETDTEVLVHLIEEGLKAGKELLEAVRDAVERVRGSYALAVISAKEPGKIVGARHGSPLVLGLAENEKFLASDVAAILEHTRTIIFLEEGEIVSVTAGQFEHCNMQGERISRAPVQIDWDVGMVEKGGFEKFMLKEIHEQPESIAETMLGRILPDRTHIVFPDLCVPDAFFRDMRKMWIVSCGTAYFAGMVGKYMLEHFTGLPVENDLASEFRYRNPKLDEHTVVMLVSQSGETADTLASLREARKRGCRILSICNVMGSTIARESDGVIYTRAGPEIGVASTKAYTAQLTAFALLTIYYGRLTGDISDALSRELIQALESIPDKVNRILSDTKALEEAALRIKDCRSALYLGRGFNFPSALEGALKIKEISYIHAEGYAAGEMKHGPIALIDRRVPIVAVCLQDHVYEKMLSNLKEVEARDGAIYAVVTEGDDEVADMVECAFPVPAVAEPWSPILAVIPLQLLAYYVACAKGCDIDKPRNLAKSVTVE